MIRIIHSKDEVRKYLKVKNKDNFMYHCCNIEEEFWGCSQFYGLYDNEDIVAIAVLSIRYGFPVLLGSSYCNKDEDMDNLLKALEIFLPGELYCHLNPNSKKYLCKSRKVVSSTIYYNMRLIKERLNFIEKHNDVVKIKYEDKNKLIKFLEVSNPGYMLEDKYLKEGYYYGIFENGEIISSAGVFSYGTEYKVLQIGNVATAPCHRNKGLAKEVISELIKNIDIKETDIVLNVITENYNALKLYKSLGFEVIGIFEEVQLVNK